MSPWLQRSQRGPKHKCSPPTWWPFVSRRRHPDGSLWECDAFVPYGADRGPAQWPPRSMSNVCGRRWVLTWGHDGGGYYPEWAEAVPPPRPTTPPPGPSGVSSPPNPGVRR